MKTQEAVNSKANNNNGKNVKAAFVHNNPVNKENQDAKTQPEDEKPKPEVEGADGGDAQAPVQVEEAKPAVEAGKSESPQVESFKLEAKPELVKHALNLEETLKLVAELNRRKIQRDKLLETIDNLEGFEIEMKEDADETDGNIYQGCVLTIEDDKRRKFVTKNPVIIFTVAQQVNSMCVGKLAEIEAGIILPA